MQIRDERRNKRRRVPCWKCLGSSLWYHVTHTYVQCLQEHWVYVNSNDLFLLDALAMTSRSMARQHNMKMIITWYVLSTIPLTSLYFVTWRQILVRILWLLPVDIIPGHVTKYRQGELHLILFIDRVHFWSTKFILWSTFILFLLVWRGFPFSFQTGHCPTISWGLSWWCNWEVLERESWISEFCVSYFVCFHWKWFCLCRNVYRPSTSDDYSILKYADLIKNLGHNNTFKYKLDANERGHWGGVWSAPRDYRWDKPEIILFLTEYSSAHYVCLFASYWIFIKKELRDTLPCKKATTFFGIQQQQKNTRKAQLMLSKSCNTLSASQAIYNRCISIRSWIESVSFSSA